MDDYFSGLVRPHIDEMKLEEEDWGSKNSRQEKEVDKIPEIRDNENSDSTSQNTEDISNGVDSTDDPTIETISDELPSTTKYASTSSSSDQDDTEPAEGPATLREFRVPTINYERDYPAQTLVAVIGREFDEPWVVSSSLQALARGSPIDGEPSGYPKIKFVPYTIRRSILVKGKLDPKEINKHDVICMCYNASEARILLTGKDGYYTELLKHVEALLGTNRGAFLVTHYSPSGTAKEATPPTDNEPEVELISAELSKRLRVQNELSQYLDADQVMSWYDKPGKCHVSKLQSMGNTEPNPSGYIHCVIL